MIIELHSLILLHISRSLVNVRLVGWFMQLPRGDVVSQPTRDRLWLQLFNGDNWTCESTYDHVLWLTLIT